MDGTINPTAAAAPADWEEEVFHFHIINNNHNNTNSASSSACSSPHDLRKYNQPLIHVSNNNIDNLGSFNGSLSVNSAPTLFHNVTFPSDPGFAERAARFSSFGHSASGFSNFNTSPNLSPAPSPSPMFNPSSNPIPNPNPNPNPNFPHRLYLSRSVPSSPTFNSNARRGQIAFGLNSGLNYNELLNPLLANTGKLAISHQSDLLSAMLLNPLHCDSRRNTQGTAPTPDAGSGHSNLDHTSFNKIPPDHEATFITGSGRPSISAGPPLTLNSTCKKRKSNSSGSASPGVPVLSKQLISHNNISKPSKSFATDMNIDDLQLTGSSPPRPRPGDTRALHASSALIMPPEEISLIEEKVCQLPLKDEAAEEILVAGIGLEEVEDDQCDGTYATNNNNNNNNSTSEAIHSASATVVPNSEVKISTNPEEATQLDVEGNVLVPVVASGSSEPIQPKPKPKPAASHFSDPSPPKQEYIHVRARRGQATDSHSLAERVRREKISERMKFLQDLVPGCNKVTGKAVMLDEIINYVQSLQRQVEFLSMKLSTVSSPTSINLDAVASFNGTLNLINRSNNSNNNSNSNSIQTQNPLPMLPNNMQATLLHSTNNASSPSSNTTNNHNVHHTAQLYSSNMSLQLDPNQGTPHHDAIHQVTDHPSALNSSASGHQQLRHNTHILQQQLDAFSKQQQHHVGEAAAAHPPPNTTHHNIAATAKTISSSLSSVVVAVAADRGSHDDNDVDNGNDNDHDHDHSNNDDDEASGGVGGSSSNRFMSRSSRSSRRRRGSNSWEVMDELQSIVQMRFPTLS